MANLSTESTSRPSAVGGLGRFEWRGAGAFGSETVLAVRRHPTPAPLTDLLQHAEQIGHPADEEALLVYLDPSAGGSREDDVVAGNYRHRDAGLLPPVETRADGEDDALLGRWLVGPLGDHQARAPDAIRIQLLDHHTVEDRP